MTKTEKPERPIELMHRDDVARSEIRIRIVKDGRTPVRLPPPAKAHAFPDWPTKQ
jgi:hypothetical protein